VTENGVASGLLAGIPPALRQHADLTGSRELLWPAEAVSPAVEWLAAERLGIVGVEAYGAFGQARGHFLGEWPTDPRQPGEPWDTFVARSAAHALAAVTAAAAARADIDTAHGDRYFFAVCTEEGYPGQPQTS
jgi:hypothetical protein